MKAPLYKYLPRQYAEGFVKHGEVLFRSLSYFRAIEDKETRGDQYEGTRVFYPKGGLKGTNHTQGNEFTVEGFTSTANERDILIFCTSTSFDRELATRFHADVCIEIFKVQKFASRIRSELRRRKIIKFNDFRHQAVRYYLEEDPPEEAWALPDLIAMCKLKTYEYQHEHRFEYCINNAFKFEGAAYELVLRGRPTKPRITDHREEFLRAGSLEDCCRIHPFENIPVKEKANKRSLAI